MSRAKLFLLILPLFIGACCHAAPKSAPSGRAEIPDKSRTPYLGAIAVDAASGIALAEDAADAQGYPASVLKIMGLYVILEKVDKGQLRLDDMVMATAEAANTGGSQVYLKEKEKFTVDELLYALMVQSANDAAVALAIHVGGSKDGFVQMMNEKATELGLKNTRFNSVHGLPPSAGQLPDTTTARDLATLARALITRHPSALKYTGTKKKGFRNDTFGMQNHNPLLETYQGCDGLKTGYYRLAGFSIVATASRNNQRAIVVILGSADRKIRDAKAAELLNRAFTSQPAK